MKLVRSDSPEVVRFIASTGALASWGSMIGPVCVASALGLLIALAVSFFVSAKAGFWFGVPVVLALNAFMLWRGRSPRLNWVLAGRADQLCVRLFTRREKRRGNVREPNVIILEAADIASVSMLTVELFLDGPDPRNIESLVIEPVQAVANDVSRHVRPLLTPEGKQVFVANKEGRLIMEWKWCRPEPRMFLQQVLQECPSIVLAHEEHSELDLNAIWRGISRNLRHDLSAQECQKLAQARRLGFGCECAGLLGRYKHISFQKAAAFLAELERGEAETELSALPK